MNKGIDVSKWDPKMNWSLYDWDFAFIKVSEGSVIDSLFRAHWTGARVHTQRSPYHYFRAFVDPELAARRFVDYLDGDLGELPAVLDLESTNEIEIKTVVSRALTWLIACERATGKTPIVYSSPSFISLLRLQDYPDFARFPLWIATYPYDNYSAGERAVIIGEILAGNKALHIPPIPKPFKTMPYFQWTAKGAPKDVPGYYTGTGSKLAVDFNFQLQETPEPEPEEPPMPILFGEVIVTELNIRPTASTAQASLGKLKQYDLIEASEEVSGWWKLTSIKRGSQQIPLPASVCWAYEGLTNGYIRDLSGPTPDPTPAPGLPVINVTVSGEGYESVIVELRPRA